MKAIVLNGIEAPLTLSEVPVPELEADEALVALRAAGMNKRDWWIYKGQYAGLKFPIILGSDGSGIVQSVGAGLPQSWIGQEVMIYPAAGWGTSEAHQNKDFQILGLPVNGCYAEFVKVKADMLYPKPAYLDFTQAAAFPVAGLTAYRALFVRAGWQKGDKVLISGVGGGAGTFALQYALAAGAEVWVTSGSAEKIQRAVNMGARGGANYKESGWAKALLAEAGSFDVIIDSALGDGFADLVTLAGWGARIAFFGGTAGNIPPLNGRPIFWKQISVLGTTMGSPRDFEAMLSFIQQHQVKPVIDEVFTLQEAGKAMERMSEAGSKFGKMVLTIGS
ncbi:NADPH:quinone reductase [Arachidicoccus rhizosphaerae]|uniref:NADPH:quinone reductase n=1 Tax=Arachidicoccus rhizosphaerae TaxID=551991 RepID=A0A1H4CYG5_9BACT|nr:zinc-binding dehydrogenase [Arachidicoccus rhizosphaerae]SEA65286.1 NADPH:quinone reductase [Arachidicoccus rhizosphaerae]